MVTPGDVVTDGGYTSLKNQEKAKEKGVEKTISGFVDIFAPGTIK